MLKGSKNSNYKKIEIIVSMFVLVIILGLFLFFYMGYNVQYDLKNQINSYLSSKTDNNLKILRRVSVNNETYKFLKDSVRGEVQDLSDFEGDFGNTNDEYFVCSIDGKKAGIIMTKINGYWRVTSIQVYN
ncbi:hypothetical protein [Lentilactobacillus farraginis]|uniref:hypothetical protein n=1 Tax=Lentilactobacillus farraginis TaxID=390841 RepID=UPI000552B164|nr:hypothetical protein [Lentilactobacillus farraginis]